ncbi:MAG TPA: hypothetical protein VGB99_02460 [Acidobacteriota bacterium]
MWPTSLVRGVPKRPWDGAASVALAALLLLSAAGCAARQRVQPQILTGSFHGETDDGRPVVITFTENEEAFRGEGTIGGEPLVLAGAVGWRGVASLISAAGDTALVELTLAADGGTVLLERPGQKPLTLSRGGGAPPAASGPFSGSYHARRDRATLAQVTLVQSGSLLAGVGIVAGEPAGITGRTTGARAADGVVTLLDGTQARFLAELAADGESIVVHGFGAPIEMRRGGRP